jgi:hypothetical protein
MQMVRTNRAGKASLVFGALAIAIAPIAAYTYSIYGAGSGVILWWLDHFGLVHPPKAPLSEMTEASVFSINDRNAIRWLFAVTYVLSFASAAFSFWAELRRGPTLYLAAGFTLGTLSLAIINIFVALVFGLVGVCIILILRTQRDQPLP